MIECRGVSFSYDGAAKALDGIDLNIEDGEFFCILGGNGSEVRSTLSMKVTEG